LPLGAPFIKTPAEYAVYVRHHYLTEKTKLHPGRYPRLSKELEALQPLMLSIALRIPRDATVIPDTSNAQRVVQRAERWFRKARAAQRRLLHRAGRPKE
jgi:hypothetical protein